MKKLVLINLALVLLLGTGAFGQTLQTQESIETIVIDRFEGDSEWDWEVSASRYLADGFPQQNYFSGIPNSLRFLRNEGEGDPKVLGIRIAYNRKGDNWFEVYPVQDGSPYEIPLIGTVTQLDFWVWGAHYRYFLDVLVRDSDGSVHVLKTGDLAFDGWRNVIVNIPGWMRQNSRASTGRHNMSFVGFRIRTDPNEIVDQFTIFFDQMKYTTKSLSNIFDGYELQEADFGDSSSGGTSNSNNSDSN